MRPLVTIGIPFFNEKDYLAATIDSTLRQTYSNIRILICDNCSTDSSGEIAKDYSSLDSRIHLIRHERNNGALFNFDFALRNAESRYFLWLGGHDVLKETFVEECLRAFENNSNAVLVYPKSEFIDSNGHLTGQSSNSDISTVGLAKFQALMKIIQNLHYCTPIHGMFRTEIIKSIPLINMVGNDNFILFCASSFGSIIEIPEVLYLRRLIRSSESKTQRLNRYRNSGIYQGKYSAYSFMYLIHLKYLIGMNGLTFMQKIRLARLLFKGQVKNAGRAKLVREFVYQVVFKHVFRLT